MSKAIVSRRNMLRATASTTLLGSSACWGSFNLTGKVYDWNGHFESKWASWGIFVVFVIIPVYGTLLFIDAVIINTIEFYSHGKNPIERTGGPGANNISLRPRKGDQARLDIADEVSGEPRQMSVERIGLNEFRLLDADDKVVTQVEVTPTGGARLRDGEGRELAVLERKDMRAINKAVRSGHSPADAMWAVLDERSASKLIAFGREAGASRRWL